MPVDGLDGDGSYQEDFMEYPVHLSKIVSLSLSADRTSIVSCSEDGSVFIVGIKEMVNGIDMNLNVNMMAANTALQNQD
jgi:hypothetical protein